jgi:hypothetical protein
VQVGRDIDTDMISFLIKKYIRRSYLSSKEFVLLIFSDGMGAKLVARK